MDNSDRLAARPAGDLHEAEVVGLLIAAIAAAGGVRAYSRKIGINESTVCQSANGRIRVPEAIANALGLVRVVTFRRAKP